VKTPPSFLWNEFYGHTQQRQWLSTAVARGRLASTFLLSGPSGIGKRFFAQVLAKAMLCPHRVPSTIEACGRCESCIQFDAKTHPDFFMLLKDPDKTTISIDDLVGPEEKRLRAGICYELNQRPYSGVRRIAIIDAADTIRPEGAMNNDSFLPSARELR
jgi:DNA polymerase III subunit delta'